MNEFELQYLDTSLVTQWFQLHKSVYRQFPWPKPVSEADVVALVESSLSQSFTICNNEQLTAIATLKVEDNPEVMQLADFAVLEASSPATGSFIRQLISKAKASNVKRIWTWMWDSEKALLDAIIHAGFVEKGRHGLFSLDCTKLQSKTYDSTIRIQSISEGITITDFVQANREAFKDDPSRPLEETELEKWLEKSEGFFADYQFTAIKDSKVIGTVMSEIFSNPTKDNNHQGAWIYGLGVIDLYRRLGVASLLINELASRLAKQGVEKLWLFTDAEGPIWSFYNNAGFIHEVDWVELDLILDE